MFSPVIPLKFTNENSPLCSSISSSTYEDAVVHPNNVMETSAFSRPIISLNGGQNWKLSLKDQGYGTTHEASVKRLFSHPLWWDRLEYIEEKHL